VKALPVARNQWQVSERGHSPRWNFNQQELYFVSEEHMMAAVVRTTATAFAVGPPVRLFPVRLVPRNAAPGYLVDRQGRFLLNLAQGHDGDHAHHGAAQLARRGAGQVSLMESCRL